MTIAPMKRGWCPSLYQPMESGDGLLVRVRPPAARLTAHHARALAAAAGRFGSGTMELTQRGNVQVRGLSPASVGPFAAAMVAAGLAEADPAAEARRVVMGPVLLGDDPGMDAGATALVARVEAAMAGDARLAGLPGKFGVAVHAGGVFGGRAVAADLVVRGGALCGAERGADGSPVGAWAYGDGGAAFGVGMPFGQFDAAALVGLAGLAERFGTALRVSAWRVVFLGRVAVGERAAVAAAAAAFGIVDPADPRLLVAACIGAVGCRSGSTDTRADAARLRAMVPVHVSGCSKGCAHPGAAALTLVGRDGRYDLVRNGRAGDTPAASGLGMDQVMAMFGA